ncbi:MAG TPA: hypothetical protein VHC46_08130 [Thermodesulfobacteriota bacterium]|nr:hypothetical protein [Thermodesulfobacteriota bacterium]
MVKKLPVRSFFTIYSLADLAAIVIAAILLQSCDTPCVTVPPAELERIGELIFINECGGKEENLTAWNEGEEFASLGIGHFLWYPEGKEYRFRESFPPLFEYLKSEGAKPPGWMDELPSFDLPWSSRTEFYNDFNSPRMVSLRKFMHDTVALQARFIAERMEKSLPKMLESAPSGSRENIVKQFYRVAGSPMGLYLLVDYVNFKGEGTSPAERYKGEGWGLLQVLDMMKGDEPGPSALTEFAGSAEALLERRVRNSPPERNEKRFLPGWRKRIGTYEPSNIESYVKSMDKGGNGELSREDKIKALYRKLVCSLIY